MSVLGQPNINKGKHRLPVVCTQQRQPKETETFPHTAAIWLVQCTSPIKIKSSCSSMVLMLHFKNINPNLGSTLIYLFIFNNSVHLVNKS